MTTKTILSENIRFLREKLGLKQEEVAQYLSITREAIHNYETGKRNIPSDLISKLADLFQVDEYDMYEEDMESRQATIALAFRADCLASEDLKAMGEFGRIVKNYLKMKKALRNE
jgi:transcriptional regulator with XRE-family HTH domain